MTTAISLHEASIRTLPAALLALACGTAALAGGPRLKIDTEVWDFGTRWQGQPMETRIALTNVGDAPLHITGVRTDCGCTAAKPTQEVLGPGESCELVIDYDTFREEPVVQKRVDISTNDSTQPNRTITVRGEVRPLVKLSPEAGANFGLISGTAEASASVEVESLYPRPMTLRAADVPNERIGLRVEELDPGRRWRVTATTRPPLNEGSIKVPALLQTDVAEAPQVRIMLHGSVRDRVVVIPPQIVVTDRQGGASNVRPVRVLSRGGHTLRVTRVTCSDPLVETTIQPPTVTDPAQLALMPVTVQVKLPPPGEMSADGGVVKIYTDDPLFPELEVPIVRR